MYCHCAGRICQVRGDDIVSAQDDNVLIGVLKICAGYTIGRIWAALLIASFTRP